MLWDHDAAFRIATVNPILLSAVGQCLGHPFVPINDSLVVKLPRSGVAIRWHQDPPYEGPEGLPDTFGIPNFDCDIYLDEATIENGCLYGLAGYHLAGHVEVERFEEEELFNRPDAVALPMQPGDVSCTRSARPTGPGPTIRRPCDGSSTCTSWHERRWRHSIRSGSGAGQASASETSTASDR